MTFTKLTKTIGLILLKTHTIDLAVIHFYITRAILVTFTFVASELLST